MRRASNQRAHPNNPVTSLPPSPSIPSCAHRFPLGSGNTTSGLDSLPDLPQFPPDLRAMGGSFLIAPGYDVKFTGNFNAIAGNIVGDRINIQDSSDLAVTGSA